MKKILINRFTFSFGFKLFNVKHLQKTIFSFINKRIVNNAITKLFNVKQWQINLTLSNKLFYAIIANV